MAARGIFLDILVGIVIERPAGLGIEAGGPIQFIDILLAGHERAVGAVERIEESVTRRMHHELAVFAVDQTEPPPCFQRSLPSFQVSLPGSPAPGIVWVRHRPCPGLRSVPSMKPRMPNSPPAVPTMATSRTIKGASVKVSAIAGSAILRSHAFSPVALSIANSRPSSEIEMTLSFQSATPRLLTPQQATSPAQALLVPGSNFQRNVPFFPLDPSMA